MISVSLPSPVSRATNFLLTQSSRRSIGSGGCFYRFIRLVERLGLSLEEEGDEEVYRQKHEIAQHLLIALADPAAVAHEQAAAHAQRRQDEALDKT